MLAGALQVAGISHGVLPLLLVTVSASEDILCPGCLQDAEQFESRQSSRGYKPPGARRSAGNGAGNGNGRAAVAAANGGARDGHPANSSAHGALELDPEDAFEAEAALAGLGVRLRA